MFTKQEEIKYIRRIKNGDKEALEKFIMENQGFIVSIAKKYAFSHEMLPDLVTEGNIGFIKAIEKYDLKKNIKFSTYSYFWIKKYIFNSIINQFQPIRVPEYVYNLKKKYNEYVLNFKLKNDRMPMDKEISMELGISPDLLSKIKNYFTYSRVSSSVKTKDEESFDTFEITKVSNDGEKINKLLNDDEILARIFQRLKNNEKRANIDLWLKILKMYFGLDEQKPYSYKEIANQLNISRQRVHQIIKMVLKKLKNIYKEIKNEGII